MKRIFLLFFLFCLLLSSPVAAQLEIGGYYKNDLYLLAKRNGEGILADVNKLKLKINYQMLENANFYFTPYYVLFAKTENIPLMDVTDLDKVTFDRAYLKVAFPAADLTVGRQRIAWGTGYVFNPTDIFNPFTLSFAVADEDRAGIDAVRLDFPLGALSRFEGIILTDNEFSSLNKSKKGIKGKTNIGMYDLSLSYVALGDEGFMFGFDTAGELFGLGVRSEAALINSNADEDYSTKAILGWNYTFENGLGIDMEYYYNGEGQKNKANYDWTGLFAGRVYQLGTDYLFLGLNKMLDEITTVSLSYLWNMNDSGFILYPAYSRNIYENVDLNLEAMFTGGDSGSEYKPTDAEDSAGLLGSNTLFIKFKFSF